MHARSSCAQLWLSKPDLARHGLTIGDQVPYRRGRTSHSRPSSTSARSSLTDPELSAWAARRTGMARHARDSPDVRLVLACGFAAAGLCLVLGMTTLADHDRITRFFVLIVLDDAAAAFRQVSNDPSAASARLATRPRVPPGLIASKPATAGRIITTRTGRTIASLHGATAARARALQRSQGQGPGGCHGPSSCRGRPRPDIWSSRNSPSRPGKPGPRFDRSGRTGGGTAWLLRDPGDHSLIVTSTAHGPCSVVLRAKSRTPAASAG